MKKIAMTLTILAALALPLVAQDQESTKPAKKPSVPNASTSPTEGKIGYVAKDFTKITVKAKGAEASTAFKLDGETKITINGEAKTAADLKTKWNAKVTPKASDLETAATVEVTKSAGGDKKTEKAEPNE